LGLEQHGYDNSLGTYRKSFRTTRCGGARDDNNKVVVIGKAVNNLLMTRGSKSNFVV
jgi:hypothetical protein